MLAQVQTSDTLHFNKPFILVTRVGENNSNNEYHNPHQRYYEYNNMNELFKAASHFAGEEKPVSALRIIDGADGVTEKATRADYFANFPAALDEYKRGIRVDVGM